MATPTSFQTHADPPTHQEWLVATGNLRQVLDLVGVAEKASKTNSAGAATVASAVGTEQTQTSTPTKAPPSQQPR